MQIRACLKYSSQNLLIIHAALNQPEHQVDEFRNPMKNELKTRLCLKPVTDANFLNLRIDKARKTRGDKQLYLITHFTKPTLNLNYLLVMLNVTVQLLKYPKTEKPILFLNLNTR